MSADFAEKEREFLTALKADTGRDLEAWMAAIRAQDFAHRNDLIDWLREQGFPFARASWLERIHHNGGRPIYWDGKQTTEPEPQPAARVIDFPANSFAPAEAAPARKDAARTAELADSGDLDHLLAKAKAYRPLAQFLIEKISAAVPNARFSAVRGHISIGAPAEFAVLVPGARDVRIGLTGDIAFGDDQLAKAKFSPSSGVPVRYSQMIALDDARTVDDGLLNVIKAANAQNNG